MFGNSSSIVVPASVAAATPHSARFVATISHVPMPSVVAGLMLFVVT
jgi:hypothetical protein